MIKKVYTLILFVLVVFFIFFLWWNQANKPADPTDTKITVFGVSRGETARTIAEKLQRQGLIRSSLAFFLIARFGGISNSIQSGDFHLSPSMKLSEVAEMLTHGTLDVRVTIPEGFRNEEIALVLAQKLNIPETEFLKEAREGYMFPDTYLFPKDASAAGIVAIFLKNFNAKVTAEIKQKGAAKGLAVDKLITIASLVEREARLPEDRPMVASIILNRLRLGMKLDIDATVQYALGYQEDAKTWWKKDLTADDLATVSPFNTYINNGLPPGPIANPGIAAITAVTAAPENDYLYYVSDNTGKIHPAKTVEEHNANVAKYLSN